MATILDPEFSEADCYTFIRVLRAWVETRNKAGYRWPTPDGKFDMPWPELSKSRLLLWLLQGNEPLPLPPPLYMSGPQHHIEVSGEAGWIAHEPKINVETSWYPTGSVSWMFSNPWTLVRREGEDWILTMPDHLTGTWRITPKTEKRRYVTGTWSDVHGWYGARINE